MNCCKVLFFLVLATLLASCGAEDICLSYQHNVQAGLYSSKSNTDKDTVLSEVSIWGVGRSDSLLYDNQSLSKIFMNLDLNDSVTAYVVQTRTLRDTIRFWYQKKLDAVSGSCGLAFDITLDSVQYTNLFIDTVAISYPYIRYNENFENLKIYIY